MRRLWKPFAAAAVFILVLLWTMTRKGYSEGFQSVDDMIKALQKATGQLGATKSYDEWVGYLYTHVEDSGPVLNDVKARAFQPTCQFRRDWFQNLPAGMQRPLGADKPDLANAAYKTWLDSLATTNNDVMMQLDDFRKRFMDSKCEFLNPTDPKSYNANYKPVFKTN
jgi:hypothetical protein